jgi:hypothetical protein
MFWLVLQFLRLFLRPLEKGVSGIVIGLVGVLFSAALLTHRKYLNTN